MSWRALALVLLLGSAATRASAQVLVTGFVQNTDSTRLPGATVQISDSIGENRQRAVADSSGRFIIRMPGPLGRGGLLVRVEMLGYQTVNHHLAVNNLQQVEIALTLAVAAIPLEPLRVAARGRYARGRLDEFYDRAALVRRMGGGTIVTYSQLERRAGVNLHTILAQHLPSARNCPPAYFIDGMKVEARDVGFLSVQDIEGIEIYRTIAQVPVRYQDRVGCGAVLIWTPADDRGQGTPLTWRRIFVALGLIGTLFLLTR